MQSLFACNVERDELNYSSALLNASARSGSCQLLGSGYVISCHANPFLRCIVHVLCNTMSAEDVKYRMGLLCIFLSIEFQHNGLNAFETSTIYLVIKI